MSEYMEKHAVLAAHRSPALGYVGHEVVAGQLTEPVRRRP